MNPAFMRVAREDRVYSPSRSISRGARDDIREHMISAEGPSDELVDIDKPGDLLLWLISPEA